MERIFGRGLALFRVGAFVWIVVVLALYWDTDYLRHKGTAVVLVGLAGVFTIAQTALLPVSMRLRDRRTVALAELGLGLALMAFDGFVRRPNMIFETGPTLGSWWPVISLVNAASYLPSWGIAVSGVAFGAAHIVAVLLNRIEIAQFNGSQWLSVLGTTVFATLLAFTVQRLLRMMRDAEGEVALVRAREEVARTLHDGVLQTLAIVGRRTQDQELARIVRAQERDLRTYLFGQHNTGEVQTLGVALRDAASRFESIFGGEVAVIVAADTPELASSVRSALVGAVNEALTNSGKHGRANRVTIYVEPTDDNANVICSVKDDGIGFDLDAVQLGIGIPRSITSRIENAGGRVEFRSKPGNGVEVMMWIPVNI